MRKKLYFYRNKLEFDKYYDENNENISGVEILDRKENLTLIKNKIIDITDLILYLSQGKFNIYHIRLSLTTIDENNKIIIDSQYVDEALNMFSLVFDEAIALYEEPQKTKILNENIRHKIYYYHDDQFSKIENECNKNKVILTNFASLPVVKYYEN